MFSRKRRCRGKRRARLYIRSTIRSTWKSKLRRTPTLSTVHFHRNSISRRMVSGKLGLAMSHITCHLYNMYSSGPIQIRMFKTERTKQSELLRNPTISSRLKDAFGGGNARPDFNTSMQSESFNKLLNQADDKSIDSSAVSKLISSWHREQRILIF